MKFKDLRKQEKLESIQEGTWQVPKTMKELQKLSEMLYVPYPAKTRRKVLQFQKSIPMGDDHMYDVLDDVGMTDERRLQKWDEPVYVNVLAGKALEKEGWITGRVTNNGRSYDAKTHGFGELSELEEMTMLPRKKGNLKPSRKMLKLERVKGGKLDPLSKMGKSKLTGQEIATYYRKNPKAKQAARDPMVKKAIELALDLGGNQTLAVKEIEKMKKGLSKNSAVASALRTANEEMTGTSSVAMPDGIPLGKVKKRKELEESRDKSVIFSRPAKGQRKLTIDFSKAPNPKKAKDKTMSIAKKHNITTGKPKKPRSKDDIEFTGSKKAMLSFGKEFNLAGQLGLLENKEKLSPAKKQYYDFNVMKTKLYRFVKAKTKAHKFGVDDLILMTSPKVIEGMYKRNPTGFTRMLDKMYPNEKGKLDKGDFTVLGDFIDARGKVIKGQEDVSESTSLNEETMLYRVKDIQKPEMDKFKSSARLMKLKINIKQSPRGKETIIRLQGNKKQLMDFDAVARGKSSYGDPSVVEDAVERAKELADLKAKHKREVEQEKDEIERTKQSASAESVLAQLDALEEQIDLLEKQLNEESQTMKKVRQVIKKKSMMNVDGTKLDLTTASMIASVYDKVNPMNKKRMDSLKLPQLINLTMKVAGKGRKESTDLQEMHPKSMDAMKRLNKKTPDAFKDQMPTIGWDAGKQMYRVVMLSKKTGRPVRTSHIPVSREFPAPKDKNKINAKELGKAMKTLEKKIGMKIGVDESTDLPFSLSILERMSEAVSPAQQAAIAISKKERGEKPKDETKENRAKRDAMRDMGTPKDKEDDGYGTATDDDRKAADKNVIMQIRRVADLPKGGQIELPSGKKVKMDRKSAIALNKKFDSIRKPQDKLKLQKMMNDKKISVVALKRLLGK